MNAIVKWYLVGRKWAIICCRSSRNDFFFKSFPNTFECCIVEFLLSMSSVDKEIINSQKSFTTDLNKPAALFIFSQTTSALAPMIVLAAILQHSVRELHIFFCLMVTYLEPSNLHYQKKKYRMLNNIKNTPCDLAISVLIAEIPCLQKRVRLMSSIFIVLQEKKLINQRKKQTKAWKPYLIKQRKKKGIFQIWYCIAFYYF